MHAGCWDTQSLLHDGPQVEDIWWNPAWLAWSTQATMPEESLRELLGTESRNTQLKLNPQPF